MWAHYPAQPGQTQAQFSQQPPHQQGIENMQKEIGEVITERVSMPELPLRPDNGLFQRIIFDQASGAEPDFPEAIGVVEQRILPHVNIIVPEPFTVKGRPIDPQAGEDDDADLKNQSQRELRDESAQLRTGVGACARLVLGLRLPVLSGHE